MTDKMREEFEHYVATKTLMSLEKYTSGSYKYSSTQQSWETWQAAKSVPVVREYCCCGECTSFLEATPFEKVPEVVRLRKIEAELERLRNIPDAEQEHLYANAHRLYARGFNACRELWMKAAIAGEKK